MSRPCWKSRQTATDAQVNLGTGKQSGPPLAAAVLSAAGLLLLAGLAAAQGWRNLALQPCPFDYSAQTCASDVTPGFEFIPVDAGVLLTGERLDPDAVLHTFRVEVEIGIFGGPSVADALSTIEAVLGHPRGWTARGDLAFQHVSSAPPDLSILLASPETVDRLCAPLDTQGYLSCRNGPRVVLNVERWKAGVPHWDAGLEEYKAYLINHEVGHFLGFGHAFCAKAGASAPVMQQQSVALDGCLPNGWPFR